VKRLTVVVRTSHEAVFYRPDDVVRGTPRDPSTFADEEVLAN